MQQADLEKLVEVVKAKLVGTEEHKALASIAHYAQLGIEIYDGMSEELAQRISFAYGNTRMSNDDIKLGMVIQACVNAGPRPELAPITAGDVREMAAKLGVELPEEPTICDADVAAGPALEPEVLEGDVVIDEPQEDEEEPTERQRARTGFGSW